MATVELKFRFRVLELIELFKEKFKGSFTAKDVAEILCTDSRYAGRLLSLLAEKGYLDVVAEKPVRRYRVSS